MHLILQNNLATYQNISRVQNSKKTMKMNKKKIKSYRRKTKILPKQLTTLMLQTPNGTTFR